MVVTSEQVTSTPASRGRTRSFGVSYSGCVRKRLILSDIGCFRVRSDSFMAACKKPATSVSLRAPVHVNLEGHEGSVIAFVIEKEVRCRDCGAIEELPRNVHPNAFRLLLRSSGWLLSVYAVICPKCVAADRVAD